MALTLAVYSLLHTQHGHGQLPPVVLHHHLNNKLLKRVFKATTLMSKLCLNNISKVVVVDNQVGHVNHGHLHVCDGQVILFSPDVLQHQP